MTRFGDIRHLQVVDSTNRYLADRARAGAPEGLVVVAEYQTAGRGRLGRAWEAPPGQSLLMSILLRPQDLAPDRRHLVTAAVALAAADACSSVAGVQPALKWPNDLLVAERKLAGILAVAEGDAVVVGIGLNVGWAPPGAASLLSSSEPVRGRLLEEILLGLEHRYGRWDDVAAEYRARCGSVGQRVRAELPDGRVVIGVADDIDQCGRLHIGSVFLNAGDVVHLRRED